MEESYNFATTILTSKTPEQASAIIPNVIAGSTGINKDLISWFDRYDSLLANHNNNLKQLVEDANRIAQRSKVGFNNFPRNWNCLVKSLELDLSNNETIQKNIKQEIIHPLTNLIEKDVRISELIVNGQELEEISSHLTKDGEYQWNYKAPQSFQNLEDFKKIEIQLMFNVILNFFQMYNGKLNKELKNNENSTNYLLGSFKLDTEMQNQLEYLKSTQFQSKTAAASSSSKEDANADSHHPKLKKKLGSFAKTEKHEAQNGSSPSKKPSKLKSRVGSIFGRKKKKNRESSGMESTIPEDASITTETSAYRTQSASVVSRNTTRRSTLEPRDFAHENNIAAAGSSQTNPPDSSAVFSQRQQKEQESPFQQTLDPQTQPLTSSSQQQQQQQQQQQPLQAKPLQPQQQESQQRHSAQFFPQQHQSLFNSSQLGQGGYGRESPNTPSQDKFLPPQPLPELVESPNFIKYDNGDDDDEEDEDDDNNDDDNSDSVIAGRRHSLLQRHELGSDNEKNRGQQYPTPPDSHQKQQQQSQQSQSQFSSVPATATAATTTTSSSFPSNQNEFQRARNDSDAKYSFESGDEQTPISPIHRSSDQGGLSHVPEQLPEPDLSHDKRKVHRTLQYVSENGSNQGSSNLFSSHAAKPAPPPSRKVNHHDTLSSRDSHLFHGLPAASTSSSVRDSFMPPFSSTSRSSFLDPSTRSLTSQDTGSLIKNEFKHFNLNEATRGLNSSIAEIVNATFKDGQLVSSQVVGEVAFNYNGTYDQSSPIVVNVPYDFDKLIVNKTFMEELGNHNYKIDPVSITSKTLGGLKYLQKTNQVPLSIHQIWKYEPHQSSLLLSIRSNVDEEDLVLDNFVVSASLNQDIQATSASSRPQGVFNKDKNRITWKYHSPLTLKPHGEEKLIVRFMTNGQGSEHEQGIQIKFAIHNPAKSAIKYCSIYNSSNGAEIPTFRNLISGHYSSHS
ncbi:SYP1 [Candida oxycetoniae]|uniref:SYP1 n=1 Tax=Candida oxycetoniae TaxID=497107 RepID=A0AAI9ST91_9ASCO|nr:SYP1 [Candida oxycetoniae]KAI3402637.2 SYP1 [Candida oxycetoniae]